MPSTTVVASGTLDNFPGASGAAQSNRLVYAPNTGRWWFFTPAGKLDSGTASSGTTGQLNDTSKTWTTNQFLGRTCVLTGGAGSGESFIIGNNTATGLPVVDDAGAGTLATAPNNTTTYEILDSARVHAYVSSGSDLSTATWSEATGSPSPNIASTTSIGFGIGVPGGSNNVGGAGQYPTDGRMLPVAIASASGVDVVMVGTQIDSHYFQATIRARITAATTIAWDSAVSGSDTWNDNTAPGMDCVPQFPDGFSLGYSSTGLWWQMQDQNGRIAVGYAANSADPGTSNFNPNWQGNNGAGAPSSFDTGAGDTCQSALIPLASGFMLAVYCAGNTASPAGAGNATQTGLRFAESASATQWPTTSTGAAVPNLSATSNDPNDWGIVARTNTDIHVVRRNAATTLEQVRYTGHSGSWGAKVTLPTTGLTGHLAGSGVALVSDGTSVWCLVIDTDANHSIRYIKWTNGSWDTSWSTLSTNTNVKNFITAYMRSDNGQIGVAWTENSASPFAVSVAALTLSTASPSQPSIRPGATWKRRFWKGLTHPVPVVTVATANNYVRNITETVGPATDTVSRVFTGARSITETVGPASDTVTRQATYIRGITETVGPASDTVTRQATYIRAIGESVGPASDSVTRQFTGARSIAETVGPATDTVTRQFTGARSITESVGPASDSVARTAAYGRSITESVGPANDTGGVARTASYGRNVAESVGAASDTVSRTASYGRSVAETVGPASDSVARTAAYVRGVSETVGPASDTVTAVKVKVESVTETVGPASDAVTRTFTGARSVSESVGAASDTVARLFTGTRSLTETVGAATDSVSRAPTYVRGVVETVGPATDTVTKTTGYARGVVETVGAATDSVSSPVVAFARLVAESVGPSSDTVSRSSGVFSRGVIETVGPALDSLSSVFFHLTITPVKGPTKLGGLPDATSVVDVKTGTGGKLTPSATGVQ